MTEFTEADHPRAGTGEFAVKEQTAPEAKLAGPTLTDDIAGYLAEYDSAEKDYAASDGAADSDDEYETWEDFRTDNASRTYSMLAAAKEEIERLQAALAAEQNKRAIPAALRDAIDADFSDDDEPLLFVPEDGFVDGWVDVIARVDGGKTRKYTLDPDGSIDWGI